MQINCLSCGHTLDLHDAYDDYQGPVRCYICGEMMIIHTQNGHVTAAGWTNGTGHAHGPTEGKTNLTEEDATWQA